MTEQVTESILRSTKKALDIPQDYDVFDGTIIMHINSVFSTLTQLGVGPADGFQISDAEPIWEHFYRGVPKLNFIKSYVYLKVRLLFDPPGTSYLLDAIKAQIAEFEFRILFEQENQAGTVLTGGHTSIVGSAGDEHIFRVNNPPGQTLINSAGSYEAVFVDKRGRKRSVTLDKSDIASGVLIMPIVIRNGTYTVRSLTPRRTLVTIEVTEK